MAHTQTVLIHHTVRSTHWLDADDLRSAIRDRESTVDPTVAQTPADTDAMIDDADVLLSSFLDPEHRERATSLEWVQALSAGVDMLDVDALADRDVIVTSAAGAHAQQAAEQVLCYMLAFERRLERAFEMRRRGVWERFVGGELGGKTLGVVGLGEIGRRAATLADAVGMDVVGTKRDTSEDVDAVERLYPPRDLDEVLVAADYLLVACPLTEETRGLIGGAELGTMDEDAVLVNVARGEVVDHDALTTALQQRIIRGAALDVFPAEPLPEDDTLWNLSNVILTPHNAGSSPKLPERLADIFVENYTAFVNDDPGALRNRVV